MLVLPIARGSGKLGAGEHAHITFITSDELAGGRRQMPADGGTLKLRIHPTQS